MKTAYHDAMTMREARQLYFEANGFGPTGGYDDAWVDFKLGPIPMPFPNTKGRVRAVGYHDLHHIVTGYSTDTLGEFEISAWEIAAGCKGFVAAWILNLGGMGAGMLVAPKRTFSAFARGRRQNTTYGEDLATVLDLTVGEARTRFASNVGAATAVDVLLFALSGVVGLSIALLLFALVLPLVPLGLVTNAARA